MTKMILAAAPTNDKQGEWFQNQQSWKGLGILAGVALCEGFHCMRVNIYFLLFPLLSVSFLWVLV